MSLGTFNPATAYDHTHLYEPARQAATYTSNRDADEGTQTQQGYDAYVVRLDVDTRDWMILAEAMGLSQPSTIWRVWPENKLATIHIDDILTVDGVNWVVTAVTDRHFGAKYHVAAVEASNNA